MIDQKDLAGAVAAQFLKLAANDPLTQLIADAHQQGQDLGVFIDDLIIRARQAWNQAAADSLGHVAIVLANNRDVPFGEILQRDDVKEALRVPFQEAAQQTESLVNRAWDVGSSLGAAHGRSDIHRIGLEAPEIGDVSTEYREAVLETVRRSAEAARNEALDGLGDLSSTTYVDPGAILDEGERLGTGYGRNAGFAIDASARRAHAEAEQLVYEAARDASGRMLELVWASRLDDSVCPCCAALHGTRVKFGEEFPHDSSFYGTCPKVFGNLKGPPRHPRCRCVILPWRSGLGEDPPHRMREAAKRLWRRVHGR